MWPLRVSCKIWFSSACRSCVRRLVRRMRRPIARRGKHHERQHGQAHQRQLPIVAHHHERQRDGAEQLPQKIRQHLRSGHLDLVHVVHDGRHQLARGMRLEELRALLQHLVEDRFRRSVTAENPA